MNFLVEMNNQFPYVSPIIIIPPILCCSGTGTKSTIHFELVISGGGGEGGERVAIKF